MPTNLARITGAIPYVTKSKDAVVSPPAPAEYVSEFVPLTAKVGDVLLNLSDGAYYEVTTAGSGTAAVLVRGDAQAALVVAAAPPTGIDGKSPYTAITNLIPTLTVSQGVITGVSYADNRENPALGPDYVAYANSLYEAVFPAMTGSGLTAASDGTDAEKYAANLAAFKAALADPTARVAIQTWCVEGGLLALILGGRAPFDDGDLLRDNVALDASGAPYSSTLGVAAKAVTGRNPQRGPFDYVVVPGSAAFAGALCPEVTDLPSLVASKAYLPGRAVQVVVGGNRDGQEATPAEIADSAVTKVAVPVFDKAAWKADESVYIGDIEVAWTGAAWALRDLTEPGVVTGLTASNIAATSLDLEWTNPSDIDLTTVIVRKATGSTPPATASAGSAVTLGSPTAESVTVSGLTSDTDYAFSVFTRDADGNTSAKVSVLATTPDVTAPGPVTGLAAGVVTNTEVPLSWTNPTDEDLAAIVVRRAAGAVAPANASAGTGVALADPLDESVTDTGLSPDTQYSYAVFAQDEVPNTSAAATVTVTTTNV